MPFPVGFFYTSLSSLARMLPERKSADDPTNQEGGL
jgi:hypothetical protein